MTGRDSADSSVVVEFYEAKVHGQGVVMYMKGSLLRPSRDYSITRQNSRDSLISPHTRRRFINAGRICRLASGVKTRVPVKMYPSAPPLLFMSG